MAPWCRRKKDPQFKTDITKKVGSGRASDMKNYQINYVEPSAVVTPCE